MISFSFILVSKKWSSSIFFHQSSSLHATFFAQQKQSRILLETDEAEEAFNVTENKTNFIKDVFFPEILLRSRATTELIVYKEFFKYILLNCTMNRNICKRTYLIGAFIQHLTHFWLNFLKLFLDIIILNTEMLHAQKTVFITLLTKISMILLRYIAQTYIKVIAVS